MMGSQSWFAFQHESGSSDKPKIVLSNIDPTSRLFFFYAESSPPPKDAPPPSPSSTPAPTETPACANLISQNVLDVRNKNLSPAQRILLLFHQRLGHVRFQTVQSLFQQPEETSPSFLDSGPTCKPCLVAPSKSVLTCPSPACATCNIAKARRRPTKAKKTSPNPDVIDSLRANDLQPGDCFSVDQYESSVRGRLPHTRGRERSTNRYCGGTLFFDHASTKIFVRHQVSLKGPETVDAKRSVEREALFEGVLVKKYHSDNGIFASRDFEAALENDGQFITKSGVGAKHQNAVAERAIGTVQNMARAMLLHVRIHWPDEFDPALWPFAVDYAVWIYNNMPLADRANMSPNELFSKSKVGCSMLQRARVFGCPCYVLDSRLQDGRKIPKWKPRSRTGMFLGFSSKHSSLVGMILNIRTGYISPQFHVVYDEKFETVTTDMSVDLRETWIDLWKNSRDTYLNDWDVEVDGPLPKTGLDQVFADRENNQDIPEPSTTVQPPPPSPQQPTPTGPQPLHEPAYFDVEENDPLREPPPAIDIDSNDESDDLRDNPLPVQDRDDSESSSDDEDGTYDRASDVVRRIRFDDQQEQSDEDEYDESEVRAQDPDRLEEERRNTSASDPILADSDGEDLYYEMDGERSFEEGEDEEEQYGPSGLGPYTRGPRRTRTGQRFDAAGPECRPVNSRLFSHVRAISDVKNIIYATLNWESVKENSMYQYFDHLFSMHVCPKTKELLNPDMIHPFTLSSKLESEDYPSFKEILRMPPEERSKWFDSMDEELQALFEMGSCEFVSRDEVKRLGKQIVKSTWAFRKKRRASGEVYRYKSRYCVRGDTMSTDHYTQNNKFAPVVDWVTIRLLFTLGLVENWSSASIDFKNAFTQAQLPEPLYLELPPGYLKANPEYADKVIRVNTSLYGDVRAANLWYGKIAKTLTEDMGFSSSELDPCLFIRKDCIMVLYVDDAILLARDDATLESILKELKSHSYSFNRDGDFTTYLGIKLNRSEDGTLKLSQPHLCQSFLDCIGLSDCAPVHTPATGPLFRYQDSKPFDQSFNYRSALGILQYLGNNTRPDLAYAINSCARYCNDPREPHANAIKRIGRYLKGSVEEGILMKPDLSNLSVDLHCDADFSGNWNLHDPNDPNGVKSRTGFLLTFAGVPLLWKSTLQPLIALSTMESEYIALSTGMRSLVHVRALLFEICSKFNLAYGDGISTISTVFEDNRAAKLLATTDPPRLTPRSKHLAVRHHWFRSHLGVKDGKGIRIEDVASALNKADFLTKALSRDAFLKNRLAVCGW